MPPSHSSLQSYYAARAGEYDRVYDKAERQADLRAIEQWLPGSYVDATVLEVACGTGYWTRFIAPVASKVLAIDTSAETLAIAKQRLLAKVEFRLGDAYALTPHQEEITYTAAFAGFWFSHVPLDRQREFLLGLNAVLRPGAKVVLLDNLFVKGSSSAIAERDAEDNTYQLRVVRDGSTHRVLKNFSSEAHLRSLADDGIAQSASYRRWDYFWAFEYVVAEP